MKGEDIDDLKDELPIQYIEPNYIVKLQDVQPTKNWGLDRIDGVLDGSYSFANKGEGVHIYIVDTGIRSTHVEFSGRLGQGVSFVYDGQGVEDCNGHGTHVAGIAAGASLGVAQKATLYPVKIFNCDGFSTNAGILEALNWIKENGKSPVVVNMSLVSHGSKIVDDAVSEMIEEGFTIVAAAGNDGIDACDMSPASIPSVITVGATNGYDSLALFSNSGKCVDILAPGESMASAGFLDDHSLDIRTGTSMATPLVAGVAALYLSQHPNDSPQQVAEGISALAVKNIVGNIFDETPNLFLMTNRTEDEPY